MNFFKWLVGVARNTTLVVAANFGAGTEKAFKTTLEIDRLIDNLRSTEYQNVSVYVNITMRPLRNNDPDLLVECHFLQNHSLELRQSASIALLSLSSMSLIF